MYRKAIKYIVATFLFLILALLGKEVATRTPEYLPVRDSLVAAIDLEGGMFHSKRFSVGFHYSLMNRYAKTTHKKAVIIPPYDDYDNYSRLMNREIDLIIESTEGLGSRQEYLDSLTVSVPINSDYLWIARKEDLLLIREINRWLNCFSYDKEYQQLLRKFFRSYKISHHFKTMTQASDISPYDEMIRENSRLLHWDWRLLAALIYQESRFSMGAHSKQGATGLMQMMPSTAAHYGVEDIFDPAENIKAGTLHLKYLQDRFIRRGIDSVNVVKFTLAAYNAGEGRIDECMRFARKNQKDPADWEVISRIIHQMDGFHGRETIRYVDEILTKYEEFLFVVKP